MSCSNTYRHCPNFGWLLPPPPLTTDPPTRTSMDTVLKDQADCRLDLQLLMLNRVAVKRYFEISAYSTCADGKAFNQTIVCLATLITELVVDQPIVCLAVLQGINNRIHRFKLQNLRVKLIRLAQHRNGSFLFPVGLFRVFNLSLNLLCGIFSLGSIVDFLG